MKGISKIAFGFIVIILLSFLILLVSQTSSATSSTITPNATGLAHFGILAGELNANLNFSGQTVANAGCLKDISTQDNFECNTTTGSATKDAYFNANLTIPQGTINYIDITVVMRTTSASDKCELAIYNFSAPQYLVNAWLSANITGGACSATANTTLNFNMTGVFLQNFIGNNNATGDRIIRLMPHLNGGSADDIRMNLIQAIVNYNGSVTFANTQINATTINASDQVNHSTNVSTSGGTFLNYTFEWNATGSDCGTTNGFQNITNKGNTGNNSIANMTMKIPAACVGRTIGWRIYVNNSDFTINNTGLQSYTVNAAAAATSACNPANNAQWNLACGSNCSVSGINVNVTKWIINGTGQINFTNSNISYENRTWGNVTNLAPFTCVMNYGTGVTLYHRL